MSAISNKRNQLPCITDVTDLSGKRVLLRASLNAPIDNGAILDALRLEKTLPTLDYLVGEGAEVIVIGHHSDNDQSLFPMYEWLNAHTSYDMAFAHNIFSATRDHQVIVTENIRTNPGETANEPLFAERFADLAELYVQDDFTVAHREHASVVGIPKHLPTYAGIQFAHEYEQLSQALDAPHPSMLIVGGAKFESKIPLALQFLDKVDHVFVSGAIGNPFLKARGLEVGKSKVSDDTYGLERYLDHQGLIMPVDAIVTNDKGDVTTKKVEDVQPNEVIVDPGPETVAQIVALIADTQFVLWGGPLGYYENGFTEATDTVARAIAESGATSIIGGGDIDATLHALGLRDKFTFISTAGGATMDFLLNGTLPGIEAIRK